MKALLVLLSLLLAVDAWKYCTKKNGNIEMLKTPPERLEVEIGETVSVVCAAHGDKMADPSVYWVKGIGPDYTDDGTHMGVVATNKATLFFEEITADDINSYKCVVTDCCSGTDLEFIVDIVVADQLCEDVYGIGPVAYSAEWMFTNWTNALATCQAQGLELAFPESQEENDQLVADLAASFENHPNARKFANENWIWLGASDAGSEGTWVRTDNGEEVSWTNWGKNQPDNWNMYHEDGQDVMGMNRESGLWDDSYNFYNRPFACKCPDTK